MGNDSTLKGKNQSIKPKSVLRFQMVDMIKSNNIENMPNIG
jgi:hypothetical protein